MPFIPPSEETRASASASASIPAPLQVETKGCVGCVGPGCVGCLPLGLLVLALVMAPRFLGGSGDGDGGKPTAEARQTVALAMPAGADAPPARAP